jgi:intracellular sulfur oxidation DsrE/DsrF family protein
MKTLSICLALCLAVITASSACPEDAKSYVEPSFTHPAYGDLKIVVPVSAADLSLWKFKMANIENSIRAVGRWGGKADIKVVLYGSALDLLRSDDAAVRTMVSQLRAEGVRILVCNNSLRHMDIDYHTLAGVSVADIVPSGFLEVAWLQQAQGYSVDPVN